MKKNILICCILLAALFVLPALGDDTGITIDVADRITVGLGETIDLPYERPWVMDTNFKASCADQDAVLINTDIEHTANSLTTGCFHMTFREKGSFELRFILQDHISSTERTVRTVRVQVDDLTTSAHVSRERYILRPGETASLDLTPDNGAMYNAPVFKKDAYYNMFATISKDGTTLTANWAGHMTVSVVNALNQELCRFDVIVVEESENIALTCAQPYIAVNKNLRVTPQSGGQEVAAVVDITEGGEFARWDGESRYWSLVGLAPGWVTLTAYGTDGSTATLRIRVVSGEDDIEASVSRTTLAAGETAEISVFFPEDAWLSVIDDEPAEYGLDGSVAIVQGNVLTGLTAGTCSLVVHGTGISKVFPITVTDSPAALTVVRPDPCMNVEESFQLAVTDRQGNRYPAVFSVNGSNFEIGADGVIRANRVASALITAALENGAEYSFTVRAARFPQWLQSSAEEITLPLSSQDTPLSAAGVQLTSDLGTVQMNDVIVCSDDLSVVRTETDGVRLYPQRIGSTTLTIWSRYCDTFVRVPIRITEPLDILYIGDHKEVDTLDIPVNGQAALPVILDYYGNPVSVTWKITGGNTSAFRVLNNKYVKAGASASSCQITATAGTGATIHVDVYSYYRSVTASLSPAQAVLQTGERQQVSFMWNTGSNGAYLREGDVTYTLSGDTDCVQVEPRFAYYLFTGIAPGTVTLTATLYNGRTYTSTLQVTLPEACAGGHDPVWVTEDSATRLSHGTQSLRCSRCGVPLGQTRDIPATGVISFRTEDFYVLAGQEVELQTRLDGSRHYSFAWESADPSVATVQADHVTALHAGVTEITASVFDCAPVSCRIHVIAADEPMALELPDGLLRIEDGAFEGCGAVTVGLPEGVLSIGSRSFARCAGLLMIRIPQSVTFIAEDAFEGSGQVIFLCPAGSAASDFARAHGIPAQN